MIDVKYKFQGGKSQTVSVKNSATVQDVITKVGLTSNNYTIRMNGKATDLSAAVMTDSGRIGVLTLTENVKGGSTLL